MTATASENVAPVAWAQTRITGMSSPPRRYAGLEGVRWPTVRCWGRSRGITVVEPVRDLCVVGGTSSWQSHGAGWLGGRAVGPDV